MTITRLVGVYNADGGIIGEVRYVVGHLLGTVECALCDITHSPLRRKPEWDAMVRSLDVPFTVLHRNELGEKLAVQMESMTLPCVVAELDSGEILEIVSREALAQCDGSVSAFSRVLRELLQAR